MSSWQPWSSITCLPHCVSPQCTVVRWLQQGKTSPLLPYIESRAEPTKCQACCGEGIEVAFHPTPHYPVCNCRCGCCKPHAATPPPAAAALPARLSEADEVHAQAASTAHGHDFGSYGKSLAAMRKMSPDAAAQAMEVRLRSVQKNFL